jgi:hypothetical protein
LLLIRNEAFHSPALALMAIARNVVRSHIPRDRRGLAVLWGQSAVLIDWQNTKTGLSPRTDGVMPKAGW